MTDTIVVGVGKNVFPPEMRNNGVGTQLQSDIAHVVTPMQAFVSKFKTAMTQNNTPPITLCMIVKNEANVIGRCLASVKPWISQWVIIDTGSTDETKELVLEALEDLPGKLHERAWISFEHNRSDSLELARKFSNGLGYILVIDADDTLVVAADFSWPQLTADGYSVLHDMPPIQFYRTQLLSASKDWEYKGIVHEYPKLKNGFAQIHRLSGMFVRIGSDGNRRQKGSEKYLKDAALLQAVVDGNPKDFRSLFYLAQSYRDGGQHEKALEVYKQRAAEKGWIEEAWYALYQAGMMAQKLERFNEAITLLQQAFEKRPRRMEPVVALAALCRKQKNWAMAHMYSQYAAVATKRPQDTLFIEPACYGGWRAIDELSLATFGLGHLQEASRLFSHLLLLPGVPAKQKTRIEENLAFVTGEANAVAYPINTAQAQARLMTLYMRFAENEPQPISLQDGAFLSEFVTREAIQTALDLGSGLSTLILQQHILGKIDVVAPNVDHQHATEKLLQQTDPDGGHDVQLWQEFSAKPMDAYELVVFNISNVFLPQAWQYVRPGGFMYLPKMGNYPFHNEVNGYFTTQKHVKYNVRQPTMTHQGTYGWLVQKPKLSAGGCTPQKIVIGLGTGRCGTMTLATLLDKQPNAFVTHEFDSPIAWDADPETITNHLKLLQERPYGLVGDVGSYYLPHIEQLLDSSPNLIIVGLRRNQEETVESFCRWTGKKNHWMHHDGKRWVSDPWDVAFPKFEVSTKKEAVAEYWKHYYDVLENWAECYPERVKIFDLHQLNDAVEIHQLLTFVGQDQPRVILGVHRNKS